MKIFVVKSPDGSEHSAWFELGPAVRSIAEETETIRQFKKYTIIEVDADNGTVVDGVEQAEDEGYF